jgi:phenylpropionate dioxygenase-like ring-hydroxylating dioxygenase large terminal subunit
MIACLSRELGRSSPLGVIADGHPLALFRDGDGRPAALEDRCAHRNTPLSAGTVKNGRLACRYHGWTYLRDGTVSEIPAECGRDPSRTQHAVRSFHALEQDGFVWVASGEAPPRVQPLGFPHFRDVGWTSFVMKTKFEAPISACLENFLDCPHATFLHRHWFRAPTSKTVKATVRTLEDGAEAEFFEEPRENSLVWLLLSPRHGPMRHTDRFIAPRTSRVDYEFPNGLHYTITSSCTALSSMETQVYTVITFRYAWFGALVRLVFEPLARHIIRQDVNMLGMQYRNVARFGGPKFASTRADLLGRHIDAWRHALENGGPSPAAGDQYDVELRL